MSAPAAATNVGNQTHLRPFQNGRVTYVTDKIYPDETAYAQGIPQATQPYSDQALHGIQEVGPLSRNFFSPDNIKWIQDNIRYEVYRQSGSKHTIDNQNETELYIIMRGYYLQYASNMPALLRDQILYLNQMVIRWCVSSILTEIDNYLGYLNSIEQQPVPIPLPENVSSKGSKTLRSVVTTF